MAEKKATVEKKAARDAFGETLVELGREDKRIVAVSADLEDSTRAEYFKKEFPDRFFTLGISEQDMIGTAVGLALNGFIPFASSFSVFITNVAYAIIRIAVCYNNVNVKLVGSHVGVTVGPDGATAQCLEDIAIMRVLPNLTVLSPCDFIEACKATRAMAEMKGPVYMRVSRGATPIITGKTDVFEIGKANILKEGKDVTIIATGVIVSEALEAAQILSNDGIEAEIINMHTIKPIDSETIIKSINKTGAVVTGEEHQVNGGLGSAVAEVLCKIKPVPLEMVAVKDTFGESGTPDELLAKYNLKDVDIVEAVKKVLKRRNA